MQHSSTPARAGSRHIDNGAAAKKAAALLENPGIIRVLHAIVHIVAPYRDAEDDLMQLARVRLWLMAHCHPHQTESWYLENCKFYLQHQVNGGRSIDSWKRRGRVSIPPGQPDLPIEIEEAAGIDQSFYSTVARHEIETR